MRQGLKVVFRTEAGPSVGGGHAMRCLAVAEALRTLGVEADLSVTPDSWAAAPALAQAGFVRASTQPSAADLVVFDGYGLDEADEQAWAAGGARIAVIDDVLRPHRAALWIDPTPGRKPEDYRASAPQARVLSGPMVSPMRPGFANARDAALARRRDGGAVQRVLVGFGLTDPGGASLRTTELLAARGDLQVDVAVGSAAPTLPRLRRLAGVALHVDAEDMAALTSAADLAVGAAGVSCWERCALGLPSVTLIVADNQAANARALTEAGAAAVLGAAEAVSDATLLNAVDMLIADAAARRRMSEAAAALTDGRGAARVAEALMALLAQARAEGATAR